MKISQISIEKSEETISVTSSCKTENKLKLPKIELKKFDGTVLIWQGFWDQYNSSVNENTKLSDINKFSYLKSFLTGEALKVVEGLTLTKENYKHAVLLLQEQFGNTQILIY